MCVAPRQQRRPTSEIGQEQSGIVTPFLLEGDGGGGDDDVVQAFSASSSFGTAVGGGACKLPRLPPNLILIPLPPSRSAYPGRRKESMRET